MPRLQPTPCGHRGCPRLSTTHYCEEHRKKYTREEVAGRRDKLALYNTARWRKLRMMQLRRFPLCNVCGGAAGTVDHVIPVEHGGEVWDFKNLQTLCFDCHQFKRAKEAQMKKRGETYDDHKQVTIIVGPPGSGKTTYVKDRARYGDLVLDLDRIFIALCGLDKYNKPEPLLPFALVAYDAVVSQLASSIGDVRHAWVIISEPRRKKRAQLQRLLNAEIVMLDVDPMTCLNRISKDPLRSAQKEQWGHIINKWWERYEPEKEEVNYA